MRVSAFAFVAEQRDNIALDTKPFSFSNQFPRPGIGSLSEETGYQERVDRLLCVA